MPIMRGAFRPSWTRSFIWTSQQRRCFRRLPPQQRFNCAARTERTPVTQDQTRPYQYPIIKAGHLTMILCAATVFISAGAYYLGSLQLSPSSSSRSSVVSSTTHLSDVKPLKHVTTPSNLHAARLEFIDILGEEHVSTLPADLEAHAGSDWSSYRRRDDEKPCIVLYPSTTDEVSRIMKVCHRRVIPVTPYSGGTSLEGHFAPTYGGVCIDFCRMDQILQLHTDDLDVVVQPALGWETLNEELGKHALFFPPDPGPGAMIGGMVGTGCSGTNAYRYGTMREWVLALTVVLADGTVIQTRQRPRKSSAGYDLNKLFIGSEGTLGLITEATLKLAVRPRTQNVAVATFESIHAAAHCAAQVVKAGIPVAGIEILDEMQMKFINKGGSTSRQWKEAPTLFFKFGGATTTAVAQDIKLVQEIASGSSIKLPSPVDSFMFAKDEQEMAELWSARKHALWSVMAMRRGPDDHLWTTDVAVPMSKLPDIIEATKADIANNGLLAGICGHVGDGNFHGESCTTYMPNW